jgi:DNA repair protein RadC
MEQKARQAPEWSRVAEVEIVYKPRIKNSQRPQVQDSAAIYHVLKQLWDMNRIEVTEELKVLLLNCDSRVIGVYNASAGGITSTLVDPRLILATALKSLATGIILAHNHPSGNLKPSRQDKEVTKKLITAAKYHDIAVIDHIIITREGYYSFADEGLI